MKQIRTRLTYANVMSTIAVFLVLGGATAFAAAQLGKNTVGNKQLKKNAVTAAKIANGAVTQDKISASAQTALKGGLGPAGPRGPQGAPGPQGARGPSNGRATSTIGNEEIGKSEGAPVTIEFLELPPGKWMVIGETGLTNVSGATRSAWCSLDSETEELGRTRVLDEAPETQVSGDATVLGAVDLPKGGIIEFLCWATGNLVFTPANSRPAMQAIQVDTLSVE